MESLNKYRTSMITGNTKSMVKYLTDKSCEVYSNEKHVMNITRFVVLSFFLYVIIK